MADHRVDTGADGRKLYSDDNRHREESWPRIAAADRMSMAPSLFAGRSDSGNREGDRSIARRHSVFGPYLWIIIGVADGALHANIRSDFATGRNASADGIAPQHLRDRVWSNTLRQRLSVLDQGGDCIRAVWKCRRRDRHGKGRQCEYARTRRV